MTRHMWRPLAAERSYDGARPAPGDVVAYDHRAWTVQHLHDADPTPDEQARLDGILPAYRDRYQPYRITLRRLHGAPHPRENSAGDIALRARASSASMFPIYPDGRVPLCSCHDHPWPCAESLQQAHAEQELRRAEKALRLLPGCCPACEEPVTSRQRSITFDGPNVRNPLAEGPTFHLRRTCRDAAAAYENLWVAAEPGRSRSLLTLTCTGTLIVHHDGTGECCGAEASDCPSIFARHRQVMACYWQTHGCGRGCTQSQQSRGVAALVGRPKDPRAVQVVEAQTGESR